jgi:sugar phosphate isomerase/epimerase
MHPRLSVNTIGYGPVPVVSVLDDLAAHGIRRIGIPVTQLEAQDAAANAAALRAGGFDVVDIVEPSVFTLARPQAWGAQRDRLRRCVDLAARVGAPILYLTTGPAGGLDWEEAAHAFRDAVAPVLDHAAAAGVRIAVENTVTLRADLGFVHRVADAVDAAALAGISVCADLFGAWTDRDLRAALRSGAGRFALVQVADYVLGTTRTSDRAVPGDGDIPIARQLGWLAESGYTGPVELELLGPRITAEGPATAAARAATIISRLL